MKFKLLITVRVYDYASQYSTMQHQTSQPFFSHNVCVPPVQSVSIKVIKFDTIEEAEYALIQIAQAGHTVTRLYKVPNSNVQHWVPNTSTGV
jgi:hypothetical protein